MKTLGISCLVLMLTGCSVATEMIAPVGNFLVGLYNADTYYSKECAWYEEVKFTDKTKTWITENTPPKGVIKDLAKVARNNDIYLKVCYLSENN